MKFEDLDLDERVLAGVKAAGYITPTPIQEQAIPLALGGRDLLGLAQTGTGKTAGFVLPILQRLIIGDRGAVRALVLAPTRELAEQTYQFASDLGRNTNVRAIAIYGGVSKDPQVKALARRPGIVVACPGRLLDHMNDRSIDLSRVEMLVLDEADTMCDMGFLPDIRRILARLPKQRQTLFFAATMPSEIRSLSHAILNDPATVQIGIIAPAKTVSHALYPVSEALKKQLLINILQHTATGRVMIFTRTKHRARRLAGDLENAKYRVAALQGNMSQNRRQQAINGFRDSKYDLLVATDVASRGIDVSEVSHVINFDMPNTVDAYIHRIGRTGRAKHAGEAFTFSTPEDEALVRKVEATLGASIERRRLPDFDYGSFNPEPKHSVSRATTRRGPPRHLGPAQLAQPRQDRNERQDSRTASTSLNGQHPGKRNNAKPSRSRRFRGRSIRAAARRET
ncbi:DEAD/DEAH box helicase [Dehalococcoidia bacterium]|nr:DEAD/DEAH box helicase [Dehalococcoidia bacterium]